MLHTAERTTETTTEHTAEYTAEYTAKHMGKRMKIMLQHAAHCRSGDKGNTSNISVIAYAPELYRCIKDQLTEARFKDFYAGVVTGPVTRYPVDGLHALNFVAEGLRQIPVGAHSCIRTGRSRRSGIALAWNGLIYGLRRTANSPGTVTTLAITAHAQTSCCCATLRATELGTARDAYFSLCIHYRLHIPGCTSWRL